MKKVYGVHWTTGFATPCIELFSELEKAKDYRNMILDQRFERFVPIEVFVDEERLLKVILQNLDFETMNLEFNWDPVEPGYANHYDWLIDYYIESKQVGYELLMKHLSKN